MLRINPTVSSHTSTQMYLYNLYMNTHLCPLLHTPHSFPRNARTHPLSRVRGGVLSLSLTPSLHIYTYTCTSIEWDVTHVKWMRMAVGR